MLTKILAVVMILICIILSTVVLMQEGKNNGLGAVTGGSSDTYWSKNKSRSREGKLELITKMLAVAFFVLSLVLSSRWFT